MIRKLVTEILQGHNLHGCLVKHHSLVNVKTCRLQPIYWRPLIPGFVKIINCDGAASNSTGDAACGGVIRDHHGTVIVSFSRHLVDCSSLQAELWAIFYGVQLARDRGFERLCVESDSMIAVIFLKLGCAASHVCYLLVSVILALCQNGVKVSQNHTLRGPTQVADTLSKYGLSLDFQSRIFYVIPSFLALPVMVDVSSTHLPHGFQFVLFGVLTPFSHKKTIIISNDHNIDSSSSP